MAILFSAQDLEKSFGSHLLFRNLSFGVETGDRVGLIGPNGAGKSTLLKIIAGVVETDGGEIIRSRGLRVGYLEQSPEFARDQSIFEAVAEGAEDDYERLASVHEWIARLELLSDGRTEETRMSELSGGWKKRVALARELVKQPDLLILDEPTNHLDLEAILWLEKLLQEAMFATLTVTHDRMFLQRIANRIIDLDRRHENGLIDVRGTYAEYLEVRESLISAQERREVRVGNTLRRETEWLRRGAKARTTKQQARIDRAGQIKGEAEDLRERNRVRAAQIDFQSADRNPQKLIEAISISKSFGDREIFSDLELIISPKSRLGLVGANGTGKTTLIRVLLGDEPPTSGTVKRAEKLQVAYFAQHRDELDPSKSVMKTICPDGDYVEHRGQYVYARSYLDRFLFRSEQMDMPVGKLSGGEKSRLRIAQLMLKPANMLVLDEPTNDLDLPTLNVLEETLRTFDGAVVLVTHDRYFLDQVANQILAFTGKTGLERFADSLQLEEWLESGGKSGSEDSRSSTTNKPVASSSAQPASAGPKKKLSFNEKRELEGMEKTILENEARLEQLTSESQKPENLSNAGRLSELTREMAAVQSKIDALYKRWAELEK